MHFFIARPDDRPLGTAFAPDFFQIAYVTNDLDRALAIFRDQYGVRAFTPIDAQLPEGGDLKIRVAWHGGTMIELIDASGPGSELYRDVLPEKEFAIRHHHFGLLVENDAQWDALKADLETQGRKIVIESSFGDAIRFFYVKAPELGHYLEYVQLYDAGRAMFEGIAAN